MYYTPVNPIYSASLVRTCIAFFSVLLEYLARRFVFRRGVCSGLGGLCSTSSLCNLYIAVSSSWLTSPSPISSQTVLADDIFKGVGVGPAPYKPR